MIATSICQKALAVVLLMLIVSTLLGCEKENVAEDAADSLLPGVVGDYFGYLLLGSDSLPNVKITVEQISDSTLRVVPGTDLMATFSCEIWNDDGILMQVDDASSTFFSINLLRSPYEMEIYYSISGNYFRGGKSN